MFKHIRKITSLLLVLALVTVSMGVFAVSAHGNLSTEEFTLTTPSPFALYSVIGANASPILCKELATYNVPVTSKTLIEILPMESSDASTVLSVTNTDGNSVIKDIFVAVNEDGEFEEITPIDENASMLMGGSNIYLPDNSSSLIRATATYNVFSKGNDPLNLVPYYQPTALSFIYYPNGVDTVSYAWINYECYGFEFTYPGFVDVSGGVPHTHNIVIAQSNPSSNYAYYKSNPYRTDRVLLTGSGYAGLVGHFINFNLTINGSTTQNSVRFIW